MKKALSLTIVVLLVIAGFLLAGCDKENIDTNAATIKYGTSFGFCVGNCFNELTVTKNKLELNRKKNPSGETKCSKPLSNEDWNLLIGKIDAPKFNNLNDTYGCPDCADGGAEWIEIKQDGKTKRVVFDYHKEPEAVKPYIDILRSYVTSFEDCK